MESTEPNRGIARLDDYRRRGGRPASQAYTRAHDPFADRRKLMDDLLILSDCLLVVTEILTRLTTSG